MKDKFRFLPGFSLSVVTVYFVLNSLLLLEWLNMQGTLSAFASIVFTLDCFTWHIYGLIAIVGFLFRVSTDNKSHSTSSRVYIVLHFIFMTISFFEIYHMMQNAF